MQALGIGGEVIKQRGMCLPDFTFDKLDRLVLDVVENLAVGRRLVPLAALPATLG
jgi:hypothetical protein